MTSCCILASTDGGETNFWFDPHSHHFYCREAVSFREAVDQINTHYKSIMQDLKEAPLDSIELQAALVDFSGKELGVDEECQMKFADIADSEMLPKGTIIYARSLSNSSFLHAGKNGTLALEMWKVSLFFDLKEMFPKHEKFPNEEIELPIRIRFHKVIFYESTIRQPGNR